MKHFVTLALALLAMNAAAQTIVNGTDTGDDGTDADTDALHGWCQCVTVSGAVIDGTATQSACKVLVGSYGVAAMYDQTNRCCFTQGSHISGDVFQRLCRANSSGKDNSRCS